MKIAKISTAMMLITGYIIVSSVLHYVIFPEPYPTQNDLPRQGLVLVNESIQSRFVFRQTPIETGGRVLEIENFIDPGGGPIAFPHIHPRMRETFSVLEGQVTFVVDGVETKVGTGSEIVVQPGSVHGFQNSSDNPVHMIGRLEVAQDGPWEELARQGALPDSGFVQMHRAGGIGSASPAQMLVFATRYQDVYPPTLPHWLVDVVSFLVAPTARLFGVRVYYPPPVN